MKLFPFPDACFHTHVVLQSVQYPVSCHKLYLFLFLIDFALMLQLGCGHGLPGIYACLKVNLFFCSVSLNLPINA